MLAWSQNEFAKRSGVSYPTIARLESFDGPLGGRRDTTDKLCAALEAAGVIFVAENGQGPGVRLRKGGQASEPTQPVEGETGDEEADLARRELRDLANRR